MERDLAVRGCSGECQGALMNQGRQNAPSSGAGCVNTSSVCLGSTSVPLTLAEQPTGGCTLCVYLQQITVVSCGFQMRQLCMDYREPQPRELCTILTPADFLPTAPTAHPACPDLILALLSSWQRVCAPLWLDARQDQD